MASVKRGFLYLKKHGFKAFLKKFYEKVRLHYGVSYRSWQRSHRLTKRQLEQQRKESFGYMPRITVVVPLVQMPEKWLHAMIKSLQKQTYEKWELCIAGNDGLDSLRDIIEACGMDDSDKYHQAVKACRKDNTDKLLEILSEYCQQDKRIRVICCEASKRSCRNVIVERVKVAAASACGEFMAFLEPGDLLAENALYECVKVLNENPDTDFLYSDEDKVSRNGRKYLEPHFKPDFNLDLLRSVNYINHLTVICKDLWEKTKPLQDTVSGASGYEIVLRCVEQADQIYHIPKILYHKRIHENFYEKELLDSPFSFEAEQKAISGHLQRCGLTAEVIPGDFSGIHHVVYDCAKEPLVSVIIPNKDAVDDLKKCLESLEQISSYRNLEYIIVENNSELEETFQYYEKLEQENPRVKVYRYDGTFNYSKINNFGVERAQGEYLLLLNNDTELKSPDSIREMLGLCMRTDVGAVGAKLLYLDHTIQHAGVVIGAGGIAGHCFVGMDGSLPGYDARAACIQDYNAVTAACLMTKREMYEKLNGLREEFEVAFNDIDYCMRVRQQGGLVVYTPYAEFYHYESKTRGLDTEPEKKERFLREIKLFEQLWPEILENGDGYYNPNLSYKKADFALGL